MHLDLHGVDRQRHLEIAEDFPPEVLIDAAQGRAGGLRIRRDALDHLMAVGARQALQLAWNTPMPLAALVPPSPRDRKSVVSGKSVSVRVDLGGRRNIKTKNNKSHTDITTIH